MLLRYRVPCRAWTWQLLEIGDDHSFEPSILHTSSVTNGLWRYESRGWLKIDGARGEPEPDCRVLRVEGTDIGYLDKYDSVYMEERP